MLHWMPVIVYAGFIFYLSAQSYLGIPSQIFLDLKYLFLHFLEYIPLGFLIARAVSKTQRFTLFHPLILPVAMGSTYGISDEFHQYFVPGRTSSLVDVTADSMGVLVGVLLWRFAYGRASNARLNFDCS